MYAQCPDVGAGGAKIYDRKGRVERSGIILGAGPDGIAQNAFAGFSKTGSGYMGRLFYAQDISVVGGVYMMVKKSLFKELGGWNEHFAVFNDVDFCLRLRKKGYLVVFTPYAELHDCGKLQEWKYIPKQRKGFKQEVLLFREKWKEQLKKKDPYFSQGNLSIRRRRFF